MRVTTVVGARPQFIKAAPVSAALREAGHREILVHTGQHYDREMSQIFFDELGIAAPEVNLGIGSGSHGWQTGSMLIGIEPLILAHAPDWVLVYGDTNSTLAGALAACKAGVPVAHVEAGLRSFNREMPEEHNRVLTDHCCDLRLCPTETAVENLAREGVVSGVHLVGDTMFDAVLRFADVARCRSTILADLKLAPRHYLLATVHRPQNTDVPERLRAIVSALAELSGPVIFPVHPRTRPRIQELLASGDLRPPPGLRLIDPVSYLDMLALEQNARAILTDSGGVQKEAYFFGVACITLRGETEWVETLEAGRNVLVGADRERIVQAVLAAGSAEPDRAHVGRFGDGRAAARIVRALAEGVGRAASIT